MWSSPHSPGAGDDRLPLLDVEHHSDLGVQPKLLLSGVGFEGFRGDFSGSGGKLTVQGYVATPKGRCNKQNREAAVACVRGVKSTESDKIYTFPSNYKEKRREY